MATYAGKLAGLYPKDDDWLAAKCDEVINGCTDVTVTIGGTMRIQDVDEKARARAALIASDGRLTMHLKGLEKLLVANQERTNVESQKKSPDGDSLVVSVGDSLTVADLAVWRLIGWLSSGTIDGIPGDYITKNFPFLAALIASVDKNEGVKSWKAKYPEFYSTSSSTGDMK